MGLEEAFMNLNEEEFIGARKWLNSLRRPEKKRVIKTLKVLNETEFIFDDVGKCGMAAIVAGSSIDTSDYTDIDLFLLPERSLIQRGGGTRSHPKARAGLRLEGKLPEHVDYIIYGKEDEFWNHIADTGDVNRNLGALVTVSLFYELTGFQSRRPNRPDDLLEPKESKDTWGAEHIIAYNRAVGSKFLVLSRQYEPGN